MPPTYYKKHPSQQQVRKRQEGSQDHTQPHDQRIQLRHDGILFELYWRNVLRVEGHFISWNRHGRDNHLVCFEDTSSTLVYICQP